MDTDENWCSQYLGSFTLAILSSLQEDNSATMYFKYPMNVFPSMNELSMLSSADPNTAYTSVLYLMPRQPRCVKLFSNIDFPLYEGFSSLQPPLHDWNAQKFPGDTYSSLRSTGASCEESQSHSPEV